MMSGRTNGATQRAQVRTLDRIDKLILKRLQANGRESVSELAREVHLTTSPCLDRVRRLEGEGYIQSYAALLNPHHLGARLLAFVEVRVDRITPEVFETFRASVELVEQQVLERQARRTLEGLEHEARAHVEHLHGADHFLVYRIVSANVRHHDSQQIVHIAAHAMQLGDFRYFLDRLGESIDPVDAMARGSNHHEDGGFQIHEFRIEQRHGAANDPALGQALNPAPARRLGQADFFTDLFGRERAVALEQCQDFAINSIHATKSSMKSAERNSVAHSRRLCQSLALVLRDVPARMAHHQHCGRRDMEHWRLFTQHPASVGETYLQHLWAAGTFGFRMLMGGMACLVHALFPFLCVHTGGDCVAELHSRIMARRGEYIRSEK